MQHQPVLLAEVLAFLTPKTGDVILDATVGLGGHSAALLQAAGSDALLIGLDADSENLSLAEKTLKNREGVTLIHANFRSLPDCLPPDHRLFNVILADIGLSSPHLDDPSRGFSFRTDTPLDMRFDRQAGMTAAAILASLDRVSLQELFQEYGELPRSRTLADAIISRRRSDPVRTTADLRKVVEEVYGPREALIVLPRVFQAVRIAVNDELGALKTLLRVCPGLLAPGGRFAVISFHSLEDRLVKRAFRTLVTADRDPVTGAQVSEAPYELLTPRSVRPDPKELAFNPRCRSASLRAIRLKEVYTTFRS